MKRSATGKPFHPLKRTTAMPVILFILLLVPLHAHLDAGSDVVLGEYLVDFGYSPEEILAGEQTSLAFNLVNASTQEVIPFESLYLRVSDDEKTVFAGTLHAQGDRVTFITTFPAGNYEILMRFKENETTLVETTHVLEVKESKEFTKLCALLTALLLPFVLFPVLFLFFSKNRAHNTRRVDRRKKNC
ncbi:hypothetical protein D6774_04555 [Candidatus Woesearchaeota archaeon]|nr:MAG: hypothetical protein D6774_04555 [Candidatus Woesearchaeota archaeon]